MSVQASSGTDDRSKTALITGGNTGIGFATARTLAQKGFYVVIGCRDGDKALAAQAKIKCDTIACVNMVVLTWWCLWVQAAFVNGCLWQGMPA